MRVLDVLAALFTAPPRELRPTPAPESPAWVAAEFLGRPAEAQRFAGQTVLLDYVDGEGTETVRMVTVDEIVRQHGRVYLAAYCHERFDRRHFRLDRVLAMHRHADGEPVDPMGEVARWTGRGSPR